MESEMAEGTRWWLWALGLSILTMLAFSLVYWGIYPMIMERQRVANKESGQYQDAKIKEGRELVAGINNSNSQAQQQVLIDRFCPSFTEIKDPPPDLVKANAQYC